MSGWEIGDLALCVEQDIFGRLSVGRSYTVIDLNVDYLNVPHIGLGLILSEISARKPYRGFIATRFRKILPDAHEPCEAEFITLLKRGKVKA